jgi:hypothetical protein
MMTSINSVVANEDIENNILIGILKPEEQENYIRNLHWIKFYTIICYICIFSPFIFCDYYYSQNNNNCLNKTIRASALNMRDYLITSGTYSAFLLLVLIISVIIINFNKKINNMQMYITRILEKIGILSALTWVICGAIIYYMLTNINNCSIDINIYIFASLMIKFTYILYTIYNKLRRK